MLRWLTANKHDIQFILDSGAFTAWKAGKPISLDSYCKFIESLPIVPWRYFALDVIGDPVATVKNYEIMLRRGFNPIPIFTRGESIKLLDDYYKNSEVVAIGGLVGTPKNKGFIKGIMEHIGTRKTHWLGFTNPEFITHYKPYMCDSSSWEMGGRFGMADLYLGGSKFVKIRDSNIKENSHLLKEFLHFSPFNVLDIFSKKSFKGGLSLIRSIGAYSHVSHSLYLEKNIGTKKFLALTTTMAADILLFYHKKISMFSEAK